MMKSFYEEIVLFCIQVPDRSPWDQFQRKNFFLLGKRRILNMLQQKLHGALAFQRNLLTDCRQTGSQILRNLHIVEAKMSAAATMPVTGSFAANSCCAREMPLLYSI